MQRVWPSSQDPRFIQICMDLLEFKTAFTSKNCERRLEQRKMILQLIEHHTSRPATEVAN